MLAACAARAETRSRPSPASSGRARSGLGPGGSASQSRPLRPLTASWAAYPMLASDRQSASRVGRSSSTTRIEAPPGPAQCSRRIAVRRCRSTGLVTKSAAPNGIAMPRSLRTVTMITGMSRSVGVGLELLERSPAIHLRHQHVERDRLWPVLARERQRLDAVAGRYDAIALLLERLGKQAAHRRIVVHHQHGRAPVRRRRTGAGSLHGSRDGALIGKPDGEGRTFAGRALDRHVAAQHGAEVLGDGEPKTGAAKALGGRGIRLAEGLEQPAKLFLVSCRRRCPTRRSGSGNRPRAPPSGSACPCS